MDDSVRIQYITPELAGDYLKCNVSNRKLRSFRINLYARFMTEKRWLLTNDAIAFDTEGHLQNGQHRLYAIVQSGIPQRFLVARGLPVESFTATDLQATRTMGDFLYIAGEENLSTPLGASLRSLWRWKNYGVFGSVGRATTRREPDAVEILQLLQECPGIRETTPLAIKISRKFTGGLGIWGALAYIIAEADPDGADKFFTDLYDGVDLASTDAVWRLRERLREPRMRLRPQEVAALTIKAWRYQREGKQVQILVWGSLEEFPSVSPETQAERARRLERARRAGGTIVPRRGTNPELRRRGA